MRGGLSQRSVTNPEVIETRGVTFFKIAQASADPAGGIERKHMPTLIVNDSFVTAIDQIGGPDSAVGEVNATPETLHFR